MIPIVAAKILGIVIAVGLDVLALSIAAGAKCIATAPKIL
jgi:hypothetical protein